MARVAATPRPPRSCSPPPLAPTLDGRSTVRRHMAKHSQAGVKQRQRPCTACRDPGAAKQRQRPCTACRGPGAAKQRQAQRVQETARRLTRAQYDRRHW
eukprot:363525-Chlamydomonas_euryale.AAC.8